MIIIIITKNVIKNMDCKECKNFAELAGSFDNDTKYVCLATPIFQNENGTDFIYLILPEVFNDLESNCICFKNKN